MLHFIRTSIYVLGYIIGLLLIGLSATLILRWFSYEKRAPYILLWNRWTLWWAKICCGIHFDIQGQQNLNNEKAVVYVSNHESQGETYLLQLLLSPVSVVLKQELLSVPLFGVGLKLMDPIAIDRGSPKEAMRNILKTGLKRIEAGRNVLIFPQGTRQPYPTPLKYARGGMAIALEAGCKIVPIAHNAASYWPPKGFSLKPGTITVIIGQAIDTEGFTSKTLTDHVSQWTQSQLEAIHKS